MVSLERNQTLMKINKKLSRLWLPCITKVSPQYRSLLAQTDGAFISTLLSLSKSFSPVVIQTLSPSVLLNLSLNADLKQSLASIETAYISSQLASSLNYCRLAMVDKNKKGQVWSSPSGEGNFSTHLVLLLAIICLVH